MLGCSGDGTRPDTDDGSGDSDRDAAADGDGEGADDEGADGELPDDGDDDGSDDGEPDAGCVDPDGGCPVTPKPACGDGLLNVAGETCDDGNGNSGDGCTATCLLEANYVCTEPGKPCESTVRCDDGKITGDETCDDGNHEAKDGCRGLSGGARLDMPHDGRAL
jgi:cysteine-rich repeat protein